jgi:hypothetical protein
VIVSDDTLTEEHVTKMAFTRFLLLTCVCNIHAEGSNVVNLMKTSNAIITGYDGTYLKAIYEEVRVTNGWDDS